MVGFQKAQKVRLIRLGQMRHGLGDKSCEIRGVPVFYGFYRAFPVAFQVFAGEFAQGFQHSEAEYAVIVRLTQHERMIA